MCCSGRGSIHFGGSSIIVVFIYFQSIPREMLEAILSSSLLGIMSVEWMANVRDNKSFSEGYNLYETVFNKTWMSANIGLKSVEYQWMHARYPSKGVAFKQSTICVLLLTEQFIEITRGTCEVSPINPKRL